MSIDLLFASDSFKGSLTSEQITELLTRAANSVFDDCRTRGVPVADGGEGTADAVVTAVSGSKVYADVHDPLMGNVRAFYGKIGDCKAVVETALANGLPLVPEDRRDPLETTTYGAGELVRAALDDGFTDISIAIGGSATNDGGMGFARALGVKFYDAAGNELEGRGKDLERVTHIDADGIVPAVRNANFTVMCDVKNPLCGENGATYTFGAQKGASPEMLDRLERGMINYRDVIIREFGVDPDGIEGAGAAGGLGAALSVFFGAKMRSGIETVLDLIGFDELLNEADIVITGEGRTDWQSCFGKVVQGIGDRAKNKGIPVFVLSGGLGPGYEKIYEHGITSAMTTATGPMALSEAIERAEELYFEAAVRMFRILKTGVELGIAVPKTV